MQSHTALSSPQSHPIHCKNLSPFTFYRTSFLLEGGVGVRASVTGAPTGGKLTQGPGTGGATGLVMYKLRGRLRENTMNKTDSKIQIKG